MRLDATSIAEFKPTEFTPEADNQSVAVADPADDIADDMANDMTDDSAEQVPFDEDQESQESDEHESAEIGDSEPADEAGPVAGDESNDAYRLRTITIPIPPELETLVIFLIRNDADKWLPGYKVDRNYDTSPHDSTLLENLDNECETMADAIGIACDRANYFICTNSADDDTKAAKVGEILDNWYNEMAAKASEDGITEDIFDKATNDDAADVTVAVANQSGTPADQPQTASEQADNSPSTAATPAPSPSVPAAHYEVTDEAQRHFEDRIRMHEQINMQLFRKEGELQRELKSVRESLNVNREAYNELLEDGPERLPLFDKPPIQPTAVIPTSSAIQPAPPAETQAEESVSTPASEVGNTAADIADADITQSASTESSAPSPSESTEPVQKDESNESWRDITIAELDGLTEKIVDVLHEHDVITLGNWVDLPKNRGDGFEYTQLKGITEKRLEKIQDAMEKVYG
ncbi:hypothetical protein [Trichococcus shcherbakoviae]|uniref:hypothetical protein n=1 Tax=Trichococcus shcherbakoviae TaxID=2094020 RepID=UPI002AA735F8|nr:hypothetical protein [Trichococcus shcherbakoviae]